VKSIGKKVLVLVLAILLYSSIGIGIANSFHKLPTVILILFPENEIRSSVY